MMQEYSLLASYAPIYHHHPQQQQQHQQPWSYRQEIHPWNDHQRRHERQQQQQQQQSRVPFLLKLFDSPDQAEEKEEKESRRWLEDVEQLGNDQCRLTTSLTKPSPVGDDYFGAVGTMFTMNATKEVQIISFEFDFVMESSTTSDTSTTTATTNTAESNPASSSSSSSSSSSWEVEVYSLAGDYTQFFNQSQEWKRTEWTDRATATAVPSPDGKYAILPVIQSHPFVMDAYTLYSFYITFKDPLSTMKLRLSQAAAVPDTVVTTDDTLQIHVGSTLTTYPFPEMSTPGSIFHGIVHYQITQECNATEFLTETEIVLEFAVNEEQQTEDKILAIVTSAVEEATMAFIILTPDLIRYKKFHDLSLDSVTSAFVEGKTGKNMLLCIL
jgi:hypothetical protein